MVFSSKDYFDLRLKAFELLEKTTEGYFEKSSAFSFHPNRIHPWSLHLRLIVYGVTDRETLLAAILHDVVEDSETSMEDIRQEFGGRVAQIVDLLSKPKGLAEKEGEDEFYGRLLESNDKDAITIKVFDRIDNILANWTFKTDLKRVNWYLDNTKKYYTPLAEQVGLTKELNRIIGYLQEYINYLSTE